MSADDLNEREALACDFMAQNALCVAADRRGWTYDASATDEQLAEADVVFVNEVHQAILAAGWVSPEQVADRRARAEAAFPRVQGRCPTCGGESLFLATGGYVTCSREDCSRPSHATDLLSGRDSEGGGDRG
jgi:hypothetical protein